MLPLNVWDLLARAGIVLRNEATLPWLPLDHHGQGLQSLAVIFLFQAAIAQALSEGLDEGAEPVFAIEEPEVHLHPQAARTLWRRVSELPGQKIVTTHSPHFVQFVPLHHLRLVRFENGATSVAGLQKKIVSDLPWTQDVENLIKGKYTARFEKDAKTGNLAALASFDERVGMELANCWKSSTDAQAFNDKVEAFRHDCRVLISEQDASDLAVLGRRMRGEVFFARRWVLVEGPTEYLLLHALGTALDHDLDQHGVAVIDFQNNGNPGVYAALADAFGIPWDMIADGDSESEKFQRQLLGRGFTDEDLKARVETLSGSNDLEDQLLADGHEQVLREILTRLSVLDAMTCPADEFKKRLKNKKVPYMTELAPLVATDPALASKMPKPFLRYVEQLKSGNL
jgi:putative ATP-dependent endonuclease of OLD family